MNWTSVNFDWNQIKAFLATIEEGSLSAASRALGLTQPTLSRQVAALEDALEVVLFERVGRTLSPTPTALELLEHVREMGAAAARVSLSASGHNQTIRGLVRITASDIFAASHLPPIVAHLQDLAPELEIEIVAANDIQDLQNREADIAVRHVRPDQPELIARLVAEPKARFYASRAYLDRFGRPENVEQLADHRFISFGEPERMIDYLAPLGIHLKRDCFRLHSENGPAAWKLVQLGLGIAAMEDQVAQATPGIEAVLPDETEIVFPVWLTTHRELHTSRRIRLVFDTLAEALSPQSRFPASSPI